jgi:phosphatidylserine/phosphatidylglycerophosphate/cardiolipin synthase-like enzyme
MPEYLRETSEGLTLKAYRGDGCALLAFDVAEPLVDDLAGFAVEYETPDGRTLPLLNRLRFDGQITAETQPFQRRWTSTWRAPLQRFQWVHFPPEVPDGEFRYRATAMLFKPGAEKAIEPGPTAEVALALLDEGHARFDIGFTRGYLSSQAYADRFDNAPFQPSTPTIDFDTTPFEERWSWLGWHARRLLFGFLEETLADPLLRLDVFAYDLNEPDFIRALAALGPRLRLFLDDSAEHRKPGARELAARALLESTAGPGNVHVGHFGRFAHCKVLIQKRRTRPLKVLTGSANFSIRGLYVQSNNVIVFDDDETAAKYERAFEQAWTDPAGFAASDVASRWFGIRDVALPRCSVSFAPHTAAEVSLRRVADAIDGARSSVLFSIMDLGGTGPVLERIRGLGARGLYASGTVQNTSGGATVTVPGRRSVAVPFSFLKDKVPQPFREEIAGGIGQVIHHKFVVCDFNDLEPVVFAGSSNLAGGGEENNCDNLLAIADRAVATTYAVEALRLIDHYRFRAAMKKATSAEPLRLRTRSERWATRWFEEADPRYQERLLFVR